MVDLGALRRPSDLSIGQIFVPQLYNQITADMTTFHNHQTQTEVILAASMGELALQHK